MERFYITVSDIHLVFSDISLSTARRRFQECKQYCEKKGIPLLDRGSVPTSAFCKFMKINKEEFVEVLQNLKKDELNENK